MLYGWAEVCDATLQEVTHFNACPGYNRYKGQVEACGGVGDYFCASWSCVSMGHIWQKAPKDGDLVKGK